MIEVRKTKRYGVCGSCASMTDTYDIRTSIAGDGWTTIMLCKSCRKELTNKLIECEKVDAT